MRKFKFRAWSEKRKSMFLQGDQYLGSFVRRFCMMECPEGQIHESYLKHDIDHYLMQYVGLKDKNGKDIYEGDIVKWDDNSGGKYWRVCEVAYKKAHYVLRGVTFHTDKPKVKKNVEFDFGAFIYEYDGVLEVIGNIHETPELAENK